VSLIEITRRQLLKALGGGLLVAVLPAWAVARLQRGQQAPQTVDAWIHIGKDGTVTVLSGKVEVGQNARTSLTQAVAEELRVAPGTVKVVLGDTDLVPFDRGTFGSQTTPQMVPQVRRAAATMREELLDRAAERLGVSRSSLSVENGVVSGCGGSVSYAELLGGEKVARTIPRDAALTPVGEWSVMGTSLAKVGGYEMVNGTHKFASDVVAPGMLWAKVLRPPSIGAKIGTVDVARAEKLAKVVRDGDFVAVAAPTLRGAKAALDAITVEWVESSDVSTKDLPKLFGAPSSEGYECAYIAHAPLEPRAALVQIVGERVTVHTGTTRPFGVRTEVAQALGVGEDKVRVIVPDTGAGYGGKHFGDAAVEAARVAKALGVPIKLVWTREEEFKFAYCRPGGVVHVRAEVNDGRIVGWEFDNYNSGGAALDTPYEVGRKREEFHRFDSPIRQGSYRALASTFNNFARESEMNALAFGAGADPVEFRLRHLTDERLIAVLKACAEKFGWSGAKGTGIACGTEKGSYVATAVEVAVEGSEIRVIRAVTAYECGKVLNPALLQLQIDGAVLQGLGGALFERMDYSRGRCETAAFSKYRLPRFSDCPTLETVVLDRPDLEPAGAGETPIIAIAPAIAQAVFSLTGKRLMMMPLTLD
jgi:isoquinoline 1-oxidoreductase